MSLPPQLPQAVPPMKAIAGELPHDDGGWAYEIKWDGMRALASIGGGQLRLQNANLVDITARYPDLSPLATALPTHQALLDGEIVVVDETGQPRFERLQARMNITGPAVIRERSRQLPATFMVFDLLHLDGIDTTSVPYLDRRRILRELLDPGPCWQVPNHHVGDGRQLLEQARSHQLEGLVAKRTDSPYEPGRRSSNWRKVKVRRRQEFVVGGWLPGAGMRGETFGALMVGYYDDNHFRYAGRAGSGFTDTELRRIQARLDPLAIEMCPFDPPPPGPLVKQGRWVEPILVAEVAFGEWTPDGILRHPTYLGLRDDKDPRQVVREQLS